jgi:hypothetical protein
MNPPLTATTVFRHPTFAEVSRLLEAAALAAPSPEMALEYAEFQREFELGMYHVRNRDFALSHLASQPATRVA